MSNRPRITDRMRMDWLDKNGPSKITFRDDAKFYHPEWSYREGIDAEIKKARKS